MKRPIKKKISKRKAWLGWHFANETETLRFGDGRKIEVGTTHKVDCTPILCKLGLHASKIVREALNYAPGNILFRVQLGGKIIHGDDKSVATSRKYLARVDAELILREFARKCALQVIHLWKCPQVVQDYLESGDESLRSAARSTARSTAESAAWSAARSTAESAAYSATESAAYSAAWSAAESAAESAAYSAAYSATRRVAWSAARSAAWSAARSAAESAAYSATESAAHSAARNAQSKMLDKMVLDAIKKQGGR